MQIPKAEDMVIDPFNYYKQILEGYYTFNCPVAEHIKRSAKFYIPQAAGLNKPTVFVLVPEKCETYQFLCDSGWMGVSEKYKLNIVMVEPENGIWKSVEEENQYLNALRSAVGCRPFFSTFSPSFHAVSYSEASSAILLENSLRKPGSWAGIVLAGTSGLSVDLASEMEVAPSKVKGVLLSQVMQPIWIIAKETSPSVERLIGYFKRANHSEYLGSTTPYKAHVYCPRRGGNDDNQWCSNVVYQRHDWEGLVNVAFAERMYESHFKGMYRYPGDLNGALRKNDNIYGRGFRRFSELVSGGFSPDGSDAYNREWYVYVPSRLDATKPVPLVFVFHGAGGSGDEIADRSGWATVAEDKGFILVCPTGSLVADSRHIRGITTTELMRPMWNTEDRATAIRPNDLLFVRYLYDWMMHNYNIDPEKVYASGQSYGGKMSWACAMYLPKLFAAVAPVSAYGTMGMESEKPCTALVPIFSFMGELDAIFEGGFSSPGARASVEYWTKRYDTVETWSDYTYMDGGKNASCVSDAFINYVFRTKAGTVVMRLVEVMGKTHAILPTECFMIWNEWFSRYSKNLKTGQLCFDGSAVV